jgi:predicted ATPase
MNDMATAESNSMDRGLDERTRPPFLRRVRIRGYKSIAFCDVALQPLTILVGRNASGKSNFINALAFLRDVVSFGVNEAVKRHGGQESILCRFQSDSRVHIEVETTFSIVDKGEQWKVTYELQIELPKERPAHIVYERLRIGGDGEGSCGEYTNEAGRVTCPEKEVTVHGSHSPVF